MSNPAATTAPLSAADVAARIEAERERLAGEQATEANLLKQRLAPLESGDDAALDRVEASIVACRERQRRIEERIEILIQCADEARVREHEAGLNRLVRRAARAREIGEDLLRKHYAPKAAALAKTLLELAALEQIVEDVNRELDRNGRPTVPGPNSIRCRPSEQFLEKVPERVYIDDPRHPHHGKALRITSSHGGEDYAQIRGSHERVPLFVDIEVEKVRFESGDSPRRVSDEAVLPGIGPAQRGQNIAPLWDRRSAADFFGRASELTKQIDAELDARGAREPAAMKRGMAA
jgi:hypothetical protein